MSANDIDKGLRWRTSISTELEESNFGVICLTPENLNAPWILFEAGALSKLQQNAHVCTYLFGLEPADLREPLAQFQTTKAEKEDTRKLIQTINRAQGDEALTEFSVNKAFEVWWPELEQNLSTIPHSTDNPRPKRKESDLLEEILELVRAQARNTPQLNELAGVSEMAEPPIGLAQNISSLSQREREVIALVCKGFKNKQIADQLFISETTVRHHLTSIFSKLDLSDRLELVMFAFRNGINSPPS